MHLNLLFLNKREALSTLGGLLIYCHEATNITGKRVVNHYRTQLNDALIESLV